MMSKTLLFFPAGDKNAGSHRVAVLGVLGTNHCQQLAGFLWTHRRFTPGLFETHENHLLLALLCEQLHKSNSVRLHVATF